MSSKRRGDREKLVFAPGCALMLYKPELATKIHQMLNKNLGDMDMLLTCCQHDPDLPANSKVINVCPGCDKRFGNDYKDISTISLWEILTGSNFFTFPDFKGRIMSILDACPTRNQERVHTAIRELLLKMNIELVEPKNTRTKSTCCGDTFYGTLPTDKVKELMIKRTSEMPLDEVVVYCVSCIKSVFNGGKKPQYLIDLLFSEETVPKTYEPDEWHKELNDYIEKH
jgi:Fe-S oxidoreductase